MMHTATRFTVHGWRALRGPISLMWFAVATTAGAAEPAATQPAATQPDSPASRAAPRYVEECIAEKRCAPGYDADTCTTDFGKPDACKQKHAKDGFVFTCKTRNMSRWSEVWCRPSNGAAPGAAAAEKKAQ
jgi:hypothetical protein